MPSDLMLKYDRTYSSTVGSLHRSNYWNDGPSTRKYRIGEHTGPLTTDNFQENCTRETTEQTRHVNDIRYLYAQSHTTVNQWFKSSKRECYSSALGGLIMIHFWCPAVTWCLNMTTIKSNGREFVGPYASEMTDPSTHIENLSTEKVKNGHIICLAIL